MLRVAGGRCDRTGEGSAGDVPGGYDGSDGERLGSVRPTSTSLVLNDPAFRRARGASMRLACVLGPPPAGDGGDGVISTTIPLPLGPCLPAVFVFPSIRSGRGVSPPSPEREG